MVIREQTWMIEKALFIYIYIYIYCIYLDIKESTYAVTSCICYAIWLKIYLNKKELIDIYVNNKSMIALSKKLIFDDRNKHTNTRYYFINKYIIKKKLKLIFVRS